MGKSSTMSTTIQITAFLAFAFAFWRLFTYFTRPLTNSIYMLFAVTGAVAVGIGVLCFDEVAKVEDQYVGWAFLFGVGVLAFHLGILFVIFPEIDLSHPIYLIPTRAVGFFFLSAIILTESIAVQRKVTPSGYRINSDTIGPILLKMTAILAIAWSIYQLVWETNNFLSPVPIRTVSPLILGLTALIVGSILLIWVETQKRKPSIRRRKLPAIFAFLFLLVSPTTLGFYFWTLETYLQSMTFFLPIHVILGIALTIESVYIFYHPIKPR